MNSENKEFFSRLIKDALPICFQALMVAAVAAADAFMLGGIDQNSMAAVSLASQIQFIQTMILYALMGTTAILGAQYYGKNDKKSMSKIFGISIKVSFIVSIIFAIACIICPQKLMLLYTNDTLLIEIGARYLKTAGISYLFVGLSQSYITIIKISNHILNSVIISSGAVIINIILNWVFIYGMNLDVTGAALATTIARILEFLAAVIISYRPEYIRLNLRYVIGNHKELSKDFFKCLMPLLGANLLWGIGFTSYTSFMGHLGKDAAAANSITAVIRDLVCCATDGLAQGGGIIVGNALGAGELELGKRYGNKLVRASFVVGVASQVVMLILTPIIPRFIKLTPQASAYLSQMMLVMTLYMIGRAVNTVTINGIFAAGGDTMFDLVTLFITMWCISIPLAALGTYVFHWPAVLIFFFTCLDEVGKIPLVIRHFFKYKWVKDLTR